MFIFIVYAVMVWWGAYHWRRHALGFLVVLAGGAVLVLAAWFHGRVGVWTNGRIYVPVFQSILYPYIVLVVVVGICFVFAPMHTGGRLMRVSGRCRGCGYDLRGLRDDQEVCPECGVRFLGSPRRRCLHCSMDLTGQSASVRECPGCGKHPRIMQPRRSAAPTAPQRPQPERPVASFRPLSSSDRDGPTRASSASDESVADAQEQHRERQHTEQHPPDGREL